MRRSRMPSLARQLLAETPDAELLERYVLQRADDAFALLVTRYSRLVWGQCRNLLPNEADADDAFQATFLTLARSVKKLNLDMPLGPWLHGVAYRVCMNARRALGRRAKHEKANARSEASRPIADSTWESAFAAASEEVQKLPEAQRLAFVLCCIEGRASREAAALLGVRIGTLATRLTRAKQTLVERLAKQGIGVGLLALGGVAGNASVAPASLIDRTLALVPSGIAVPSSIQVLTQGVTGMTMFRIKLLAAGVLIATGLGLSIGGGWSNSASAQVPNATPPATSVVPKTGDSKIEALKAQLEKAKADLAQAEKEDEARALEDANKDKLTRDTARATAVQKFEYEDAGLTAQAFESRILEREKAGWQFLGEVSIQTGKGLAQKLAFRKQPIPSPPSTTPKLPLPATLNVKPPAPKPLGGDPEVVKTTPPAPTRPAAADPFIAPPAFAPASPLPADQKAMDKIAGEYLARIATLEENLRVKSGSVTMDAQQVSVFRIQASSGWNAKDLADVLRVIMEKASAVKKYGAITIETVNDVITVYGSSQARAEAGAWIQQLKKPGGAGR